MTPPPQPPVLRYADDAPLQAQLQAVRLLKTCVLFTAVSYYTVLVFSFLLPAPAGAIAMLITYGIQIVMMVFVIWLGMKLQNLLTGIVMAFLVGAPCAGPLIPFYLVAQANEFLRNAAKKQAANEKAPDVGPGLERLPGD